MLRGSAELLCKDGHSGSLRPAEARERNAVADA